MRYHFYHTISSHKKRRTKKISTIFLTLTAISVGIILSSCNLSTLSLLYVLLIQRYMSLSLYTHIARIVYQWAIAIPDAAVIDIDIINNVDIVIAKMIVQQLLIPIGTTKRYITIYNAYKYIVHNHGYKLFVSFVSSCFAYCNTSCVLHMVSHMSRLLLLRASSYQ